MTDYTGTPAALYVAGHKLIDSEEKTWFDLLTAISDGWTSYTPVITASTTNPSGHTISGSYKNLGKLVLYQILVTFATSEGTGASYFLTLPPVPTAMPTNAPHGQATFFDTSASASYMRMAIAVSTTTIALVDTAAARVSPTVPVTVATGDKILVEGWYITS